MREWIPWERMFEIGLIAAAMLLLASTVAPAYRPAGELRERLQRAVLTERLVGIGFERTDAKQAVDALTAERLAALAGTIGTPRPASMLLAFTALLSSAALFFLLIVIRP